MLFLRRKTYVLSLALSYVLLAWAPCWAQDSIQQDFPDAITLTNSQVYLSISPKVGRVVAFGRCGESNMIWTTDGKTDNRGAWVNYGGDKIWPIPQQLWPAIYHRDWPPDRMIDGMSWQVIEQTSNGLTLRSSISEQANIQITRHFHLLSDQPRVQIDNTLTAKKTTTCPVQIWSITQIKLPSRVRINGMKSFANQKRFVWLQPASSGSAQPTWDSNDCAISIDPSISTQGKIGTIGKWIEALFPTQRFRQTHEPQAWDRKQPTQTNLEYYMDANYAELETRSSASILQAGQSIEHTVWWEALPMK